MSQLYYKMINPPIRLLLRSMLHGLMSRNTLLLEFTGRKSGRDLSTPISYHVSNSKVHCFTSKSFAWWRNLVDGEPVHLTIKGKRIKTRPVVYTDDQETMSSALRNFLIAVPRDADHAGVKLDEYGQPDEADIQEAVKRMVYLKFPV